MKLSDCKNINYKNKQISDFCKIRNGYSFKSNLYSKSGIRIIRISDVQKGSISDDDIVYYPLELKKDFENYLLTEKDILVSLTGNVGRVAMLKTINLPAALNQRVAAISTNSNVINKYLYYCISNDKFENQCYDASTGGAQKNLSTKWLANYVVSLPHIKVQEEIVKILDSFTNLIDALNEELSLRQKQFEYYREKLLTFDDKSVYTTLGKVGEFTRGNGLQKKDFTESGFPCIHYGQIHTSYNTSTSSTISFCSKSLAKKLKKAKYGDLLIATTSEDVDACCKAIAWLGEGEVAYSGDSYCFSHNENPKYMAYLFQCDMFYNQKKTSATGAKVIRVSGDSMSQFTLPIPSLKVQQSIVEKLDAFESLISSLKEEIALRQKQYEYYREKLLTFE